MYFLVTVPDPAEQIRVLEHLRHGRLVVEVEPGKVELPLPCRLVCVKPSHGDRSEMRRDDVLEVVPLHAGQDLVAQRREAVVREDPEAVQVLNPGILDELDGNFDGEHDGVDLGVKLEDFGEMGDGEFLNAVIADLLCSKYILSPFIESGIADPKYKDVKILHGLSCSRRWRKRGQAVEEIKVAILSIRAGMQAKVLSVC